MPPRRVLFGLWYLAIAFGFALLALSNAIRGNPWPGVVVRVIIAAAFAYLAIAHLRKPAS